jgi:hypothetical protein
MTTLAPVVPAATSPESTGRPRLVLWAAVLGLAAAGAVHVVVAADHVDAGNLAVAFFLLAAAAQLGVAALFGIAAVTGLRPSPLLLTAALLGTVALLGLYLVAHTTGLLDSFAVPHSAAGDHAAGHGTVVTPQVDPVTGTDLSAGLAQSPDGPVALAGAVAETGTHHSSGTTGTVTVGAELLTLFALVALVPVAWRRRTTNALFALGALAWGMWLTGVLV